MTQFIFNKRNLLPDTGYRYIYNFCKRDPKIDCEYVDLDKINFHPILEMFFTIIFFKLYSILRFSVVSKGVFHNQKVSFFCGSATSIGELNYLVEKGYHYYYVDSIYDYYLLKLKDRNFFLKLSILSICKHYEELLLKTIRGKIFLNSKLRVEEMKNRYPFLSKEKNNRKIEFLPIGWSEDDGSLPLRSPAGDVLKLGMWGNFIFEENRLGLQTLLDSLSALQKNIKFELHLAGAGSDLILSKYKSIEVETISYGRQADLSQFFDICDAFILVVPETNGIKVKLMELIRMGKPAVVSNKALIHLGNINISNLKFQSFDEKINWKKSIEYIRNWNHQEQQDKHFKNWNLFRNIIQLEKG